MDWRKPLAAFDGQTAFDVACRAFACHISQQKTDYHVEDFGPYDNSRFGLAFSAIGEDTRKDDFFEHVEGARPAGLRRRDAMQRRACARMEGGLYGGLDSRGNAEGRSGAC